MNKKEFIKVLGQKLSILADDELKDILNEYQDIIDEKVKHGKTEEEAVAEFGSIDELTKEILNAYKINPKYGEKKDNVKEVIGDCESLIKRSAKALADFSKKIFDDFKNGNNLTIELIFEILIKGIILLILFAILRLPFEVINQLGKGILDIAFYPLDNILTFIWQVILFLLYFVCCTLISIAMFKQYTYSSKVVVTEKKVKKENKKIEKNIVEETIIEEPKKVEKRNDTTSNVIYKVLKTIFQIFVVLVCLAPLWIASFVVTMVFILAIYYLCIGINTIGIIIGSIGVGLLFWYIASIFQSIAFNKKRVYFFPFVISLILIAVGSLLTIDMITHIKYIDEVPKNEFNQKTSEYEFNINTSTYFNSYSNNDNIFETDDNLEDNKVKVMVTYYNELGEINYHTHIQENNEVISFYNVKISGYNDDWKMYNIIVDNLKNDKFYRYDSFYDFSIKVCANENTMKLLKN